MTPRWLIRTTFALALAALAVSSYLTIAHFTTPAAVVCPASGPIGCTRVTTSAQSRFLGIPVAVLGLAWSIAMVVLCSPPAWRSPASWIRVVRVAAVCVAMLFVAWLLYAELFVIGAICLWCTAMHLVTFALFVLVVGFGTVGEREEQLAGSS